VSVVIQPDDYIARSAQARALYVKLFEACVTTMPMNPAGEHNVECHYTARDLSLAMPGRSPSVVQNELRWLQSNAWIISQAGNVRFLGRRIDCVFHLIADVAAHGMTGEGRLVSRVVLGIKIPGPTPVAKTAVKRGAARRWTGEHGKGGGAFDLGTGTQA
jgi:hypothetical protein